MSTKVKVCCIQSEAELAMAHAAGADAVGLLASMPSGRGAIPDEKIARLAALAPPPMETFLLTAETEAEHIIAHHRRTGTSSIQLVDTVAPQTYSLLRAALPGIRLVQVIHVIGTGSVEDALGIAGQVDALLLDSGNPADRVLGGTGRTHDWSLSREIVQQVRKPVWLAGGLRPQNAARAVQQVRPYGLDVCSGLRQQGQLQADLLRRFMAKVRPERR